MTQTTVLSIAGFDPCSGAGVSSDIKTFEQHKVVGLGVVTAVTFQNEDTFEDVQWLSTESILRQLVILAQKHTPKAVKIGLMSSFADIRNTIQWVRSHWPKSFIIWDPILKASAGFEFHSGQHPDLEYILENIDLITPNLSEAALLFPGFSFETPSTPLQCALYLKGGHGIGNQVSDKLITKDLKTFTIASTRLEGDLQKHGTGCVLSSAITANLAKGKALTEACKAAHFYVKAFIASSPHLLGFHPSTPLQHA